MSYQPNYGRLSFVTAIVLGIGLLLKSTVWPSLDGIGWMGGLFIMLGYREWAEHKEKHGR